MSARDGLRRIASALHDAGIEHMLAGSHASGLHGIPRTTQDFDVVIDPDESMLGRLIERLEADDFYVSDVAARDALRRRWNSPLVV